MVQNMSENIIPFMENAKAWPFEEARKLAKKFRGELPEKGYVLFQTGYGPSGLPHIGTFGEVASDGVGVSLRNLSDFSDYF